VRESKGEAKIHGSRSSNACRLGGGNGSGGVGRTLSSGWLAIGLWDVTLKCIVWVLVLLAGAVDCDLNSNLAAFDLLAVHIGAGLLLQFLGSKGDETKATALARLVTGLELADHKLWNWAKGDLGGRWLVVCEQLEKLLLAKVVWKVGDHDLGL